MLAYDVLQVSILLEDHNQRPKSCVGNSIKAKRMVGLNKDTVSSEVQFGTQEGRVEYKGGRW